MKKGKIGFMIFIKLIIIISVICLPVSIIGESVSFAIQQDITISSASLVIDGVLDDDVWNGIPALKLKPTEVGVPVELGGDFRIFMRDEHLCIGVFCPEPGGKVLAKSIGYNPIWEKDAFTSPDVEDIVIFQFMFSAVKENNELRIEINPWGAIRVALNGILIPKTEIMSAANITRKGWSIEIAIPLKELNFEKSTHDIKINVKQIRSRRPLAPEFHWSLNGRDELIDFKLSVGTVVDKKILPIKFNPLVIGNTEPPLEVGYVQSVPPIDIGWEDKFWQGVPAMYLSRNESNPRKPEYPTEIKWVHDGKTLAVFFRCIEDERVDCDIGARDGNVRTDDHLCIYFTTSGSSAIEILVNPAGAVRDLRGTGPHMTRLERMSVNSWNGDIKVHCLIVSDAWYVRLDLPLDKIAEGLDELGTPEKFRILLGRIRQQRNGEPQEISTIPVIENPFFYAPARYRWVVLTGLSPSQVKVLEPAYTRPKLSGLASEISELDSYVLSRVERKYNGVEEMLDNSARDRIRALAMEEIEEWESVNTVSDWEKYRDKRIKIIKEGLGEFPETKPPLMYQVTGTYKGDGYQVQNIVYQSRPGFFVTGNLYLPENPTSKMPGIIIFPSHHYPKIQGELKDCGMIWARTGCAVLVIDRVGCGEMIETIPWYRMAYHSEYLLETQLYLIGHHRLGWMAWDIIRGVDIFYELGNIDKEKIILMGAVTSGGGIPAGLASIFDDRFSAVIPFNFGRVYWLGYGLWDVLSNKITPWFFYNAIAPKKFIYAHEFWWEGEEGSNYPEVWVPTWDRFKKVYNLYKAEENLTTTQGTGLLRVQDTAGDCYNIGPSQRKPIFYVLNRWFGIPIPSRRRPEYSY